MSKPKYYAGAPAKCDTCEAEITTVFYDMAMRSGQWANMCTKCAMHVYGIGKLGTGLGQQYTRQQDGKWLKTGG